MQLPTTGQESFIGRDDFFVFMYLVFPDVNNRTDSCDIVSRF